MIVDTSVWVESFRRRDARLSEWMAGDLVLQHPFVTAEISMGSFATSEVRSRTIDLMDSFQQVATAALDEIHAFVAEHKLFGVGIGFIDANLLHASFCNPAARLATYDKRLAEQAKRMGLPGETLM